MRKMEIMTRESSRPVFRLIWVACLAICAPASAWECPTNVSDNCVCHHEGEVWLRGTVADMDGGMTTLQSFGRVRNSPFTPLPQETAMAALPSDEPGKEFLVFFAYDAASGNTGAPTSRLPLTDGSVLCTTGGRDTAIDLERAIEIGSKDPSRCASELENLGYAPCGDVESCGGSVSPFAPSSIALLTAAAAVVTRRARQRHDAPKP